VTGILESQQRPIPNAPGTGWAPETISETDDSQNQVSLTEAMVVGPPGRRGAESTPMGRTIKNGGQDAKCYGRPEKKAKMSPVCAALMRVDSLGD
jgi:hypothetical protein